MNNATIIAERDSLRAAFIRYIALDQFIGCGCPPTTSTPTLKTCRAPCAAGRWERSSATFPLPSKTSCLMC